MYGCRADLVVLENQLVCPPLGQTMPSIVGCFLHSTLLLSLREVAFRSVPEAGRRQESEVSSAIVVCLTPLGGGGRVGRGTTEDNSNSLHIVRVSVQP